MSIRTSHPLSRTSFLVSLLLFFVPFLVPSPAHASVGQIEEIGNTEPDATIAEAGGVAVNENTGNIYVADIEGQRILEYTPAGKLIMMLGRNVNQTKHTNICTQKEIENEADTCGPGERGSTPGEFDEPSGIAVDNTGSSTQGDIYVGDTGNDRVQKFNENGEYLTQINSGTNNNPTINLPEFEPNIAVDSHGNLLLLTLETKGGTEGVGQVLQYNPNGEYTGVHYGPLLTGSEKLEAPKGVAVDENGTVYISRNKEATVEFSPDGQVLGELPGSNRGLTGVDPLTGNVFIAEPEGQHEIQEESPEGIPLLSIDSIELPVRGLAYSVSEGVLYASDRVSNSVLAFGFFPTPPERAPAVADESTTALTQASATLTARVTPNLKGGGSGADATYFAQYATSENVLPAGAEALPGAQSAPAAPVDIGKGFTGATASVPITVQPSTVYYYRIVAHNSFNGGSTTYGPTQSFTTPAPAPSVTTGEPSNLTQESATVSGLVTPGSVGAVSDTRWCFQYGTTTAYGQGIAPAGAADAGEGTTPVPVTTQLTGLWPNTLYHYRLVAVNSLGLGFGAPTCATRGGIATAGADRTFTTTVTPPPTAVTGAALEVTPTGATLAGSVDPQGAPTSYELDLGTDTSYGVRIFGEVSAAGTPEPLTATVTGLAPGTTYHYRLVASNAHGTTYGADRTFTTPGVPSALLSAPVAPPLVATPAIVLPGEAKPVVLKATKKPKAKKRKHKAKRKPKPKPKRKG